VALEWKRGILKERGEGMRHLHLAIIVIMLFMLAGTASYATEETVRPEAAPTDAREYENRLPFQQEDQWQCFLTPYLWIPGLDVNFTLAGHTAGIREPWWDIAARLFTDAIGAMGRFEVRKDRWGFYLDSYFIYLQGNVSDSAGKEITVGREDRPRTLVLSGDLNYIVRAGNLDFGLSYLVGNLPLKGEKPLPGLAFEALGGGRFNWYNQDLYLGVRGTMTGGVLDPTAAGTFSNESKREYVEPFLGMQLGLWLTETAAINFQGTVGGFGIMNDENLDSDLQLAFGLRAHKRVCTYLGYRARYEEADFGKVSISGWFHGPMLGAVFVF